MQGWNYLKKKTNNDTEDKNASHQQAFGSMAGDVVN